MSKNVNIRWGWLKGMYIYTAVGAGGLGLGILIIPDIMQSVFGWPDQSPVFFGIVGSVYLAFGLVSVLGVRSPLKFIPVLLLQLSYKSIWFIAVVLPLLLAGELPNHAVLLIAGFATYVIGDLIAIPFSYVFAKDPERQVK